MPQTKKKLIFTSIMCFFCFVFFTLTATFAWERINRKLTNTGIKIIAHGPKGVSVAEYQIYRVDNELGEPVLYYNSVDPSMSDVSIVMSEYDMYITEKNVSTPIIVRVVVNMVYPITKFNVETRFILSDGNAFIEGTTQMKPVLSNICSVAIKVFPKKSTLYKKDPVKDAKDIFNTVNDSFTSGESKLQSFVTYKTDSKGNPIISSIEKEREVKDVIEDCPYIAPTGSEEMSKSILYFRLDYSPDLVNLYKETVPESDLISNPIITFNYDFDSIEFDTIIDEG